MSPVATDSPRAQMTVRPIQNSDFDAVVQLNQNALEGVGPIDRVRPAHLVAEADQALLLDDAGKIAGFVITLPTGADYDSSRFRWFEERFDDYVYLDRIVVAGSDRRQGIASRLYDEIEGGAPVALEVYDHNEGSLAFHKGRRFKPVGTLQNAGITDIMFLRQANYPGISIRQCSPARTARPGPPGPACHPASHLPAERSL